MQYLVVVHTDAIEGSSLHEAESHTKVDVAEEFIKSYLERIVPAGSPLTIHKVIQIAPGP
jgi:hypothetical protein